MVAVVHPCMHNYSALPVFSCGTTAMYEAAAGNKFCMIFKCVMCSAQKAEPAGSLMRSLSTSGRNASCPVIKISCQQNAHVDKGHPGRHGRPHAVRGRVPHSGWPPLPRQPPLEPPRVAQLVRNRLHLEPHGVLCKGQMQASLIGKDRRKPQGVLCKEQISKSLTGKDRRSLMAPSVQRIPWHEAPCGGAGLSHHSVC